MEATAGGDRVLYLYGVIRKDQCLPSDASAALQAVPHSAVTALVEAVCAREFSSDTLDEKLASIEWVARLAHKHEAVLECAMRHGPVVPARLCSLFSNAEALRHSLAENEELFLAALERVRNREEWGLKVFCDEGRLRSAVGLDDPRILELDVAGASASPGQAFVLRKRREACLAEVIAARIDAVADETVDVLERATAGLRLRALLSEAATGRSEPMVLNVAALVNAASREAFHTTVLQLAERFQAEGFAFAASGPWPPYSFCGDEDTNRIGDAMEFLTEEEP